MDEWQRSLIYQVYVRSFLDGNGDGVGDLAGVAASLDYLTELGVTALWLSPIHPSPDADLGYDVMDYTAVDPRLGSLASMEELVALAHGRGMAVLLDWVVNHTSSRHTWFVEALTSPESEHRDWYVFRPGRGPGQPPTNWRSMFGGSAWTYDHRSQQWYLHTFLPEQPDLNWRNPAVHSAIADAMRFWLDRGIDGFRLDALPMLVKDDLLRDNPANERWRPGTRTIGNSDPRTPSISPRCLTRREPCARSRRSMRAACCWVRWDCRRRAWRAITPTYRYLSTSA